MRWCAAVVLGALLFPVPARAQAPSDDSTRPVWGRLVVLEDRVGGRFRPVVKRSREVEIVRAGSEFPAEPDLAVGPGDAIRTARGRVRVGLGADATLVDERSQVRLDADQGWMLRLGAIEAQGNTRISVGDVTIEGDGVDLRVECARDGSGRLFVLAGVATVSSLGEEVAVAADWSADFTQEATAAPTALDSESVLGILAARPAGADSKDGVHSPRAHLRIHGGLSRLHDQDFGRAGLEARIRLGGPVFLDLGASFAFRPVVEDIDIDGSFIVPAHAGVRVVGPLPRAFMIFGGVDFTAYVGEWCVGTGCFADVVFEPGVRGVFGGGLEIAEAVGLDLSVGAGVLRRRIPAVLDPDAPVVPEVQLHFEFGVYFLLGR